MGLILEKRQTTTSFDNDDNDDDDMWGYSTTGVAIKWAVVGAILILLVLWLVLGRMHAQRRMRRGQRPMIYHRLLVPRPQRGRFAAQQSQYASNGPGWGGEGYPMQAYPPPAYNTDHVPPPVYQPPDGSGSKMMPPHHQDWASVPPPGPPPGHEAGESSRTMETVPLNQDVAAGRDDDDGAAAAAAQPHVQTENLGLMSRMNPFK